MSDTITGLTAPTLLATAYDPDLDECTRCGRDEGGCVCGRLPYVELFVHDEDAERPELTWRWICNVCGIDVGYDGRVHCPAHVPGEIPGLVMTECYLDGVSHPRMWFPASDNGYGNPCPYCMLAQAAEAHEGCEHARHRAWRLWWLTHKAAHWLARLRLLDGVSYRSGGGCGNAHRSCLTSKWRWAR